MIDISTFLKAVGHVSGHPPNPDQNKVIRAGVRQSLFVVAGPGSGKTASLTLRILKLIFVDQVKPNEILATTFTKKAAAELRSRILSVGFGIQSILAKQKLSAATKARIKHLDINQVVTGTLDSLSEQILREHRAAGTQPKVLIDDFVARTLMLNEGLFGNGRFKDLGFDDLLYDLSGNSSRYGWNISSKTDVLIGLWARRWQDQVKWPNFTRKGCGKKAARKTLERALQTYESRLAGEGLMDFALLEQELLARLGAGELDEFAKSLKVILVDEYQDTNLLQEQIYFDLVRRSGASLTVVGDDDQSLYRFRGATVELFSDFANRFKAQVGKASKKEYLTLNYRSSGAIIDFVNGYATLDPGYQVVRVAGKPKLRPGLSGGPSVPILGMFRDTRERLATDLANLVYQIFRGKGFTIPGGTVIERNVQGGDIGDCALLCSSPSEYTAGGEPRLPLLLDIELSNKTKPIRVFNPRGEDLSGIDVVQQFGGLVLVCLDPGATIQSTLKGVPGEVITQLDNWRSAGQDHLKDRRTSQDLRDYVDGWSRRNPKRPGKNWPDGVSALNLVYDLLHYFPELHDDPEWHIYLEVFTRQLQACQQVSTFDGRAVFETPALERSSIGHLIRHWLIPIASGAVSVNEELIDAFPRNRLSVLSIHQSKGLEFPLCIVDVGSDFKSNHHGHRFKRFPKDGSRPQVMEDLLRPFSSIGTPGRSAIDRAFDDLYRQFFVAFSRPENLLLLVGLNKTLPGEAALNVATGWCRDGSCPWVKKRPFTPI